MKYSFLEIEKKWQKFWSDNRIYEIKNSSTKPKFYVLDMFPYPSGAGLHVGHPLGYIASDIFSRYKRHKGYNVFQTIRVGVGKVMEEVDHTHNMLYEEYGKLTEQLNEGYLSEWKFFDKVKDMTRNFVATIKELGAKIVSFFTEAVDKIKDAAKDGIQALGAVFGFEMIVNDTLRNQTVRI